MDRCKALATLVFVLMLAPLAVDLLGIATAVVKAQTATAITLRAGKPVTLVANFTISPGDAVAPHLYTWFHDGISNYVAVNNFIVNSQPFAIVMSVRKLVPQYGTGFERFIFKAGSYWFGEFSITLESSGRSVFRIQYVGSSSEAYATCYTNYLEDTGWHDIVTMYDGATTYFYVDGSLQDSRTWGVTRYITTSILYIGAHGGTAHYPFMVSQVLIYARSISSTEISNLYTYRIVNASGFVLFLDPTFYNGTHYIDLSGNNNHGVGYNEITRAVDSRVWLYLIKQRFSDGYVHFMFFPLNSVVYIYDSSGNLVTSFMIKGNANVAGLVQDYSVSLTAGTYKVVVYTYQDYTVFQNSGTTYTKLVARYAPGSSLRLAINATSGIQAFRYQIATDSGFSNILYDNTVSTSNSYIDITSPSINNTYYLRVAVQFTDGTWSPWSNTYQFRVDWLTARITTSSNVFATGSAPSILFSVTYTDRSYSYAPTTKHNATVVALGKYNLTSYWWRVNVYKGATTSAEPPNSSYYTYLGTVYTIHPYFSSSAYWGSIPSTYTASYIFQGVADYTAPYWASAVGAPSTYFAFVYQSFVYLPLSGTYTIEVYSDDGVRVYINGSLVIDKWSGATATSTSVNLNAGWYNITVKYWEGYTGLRLYLGVVLPNGTAVRPLVPVKGIKMVAPPHHLALL